ncbi:MAG: hypothetical protein NC429_01205 [Lachnospiraceae bacterium]|nr:hypothetical protein [Lachnospiraceae bacterium]
MKRFTKFWLGFCLSISVLFIFSIKSRAAESYADLTQGAEYDEEEGVLYHPDGDGILVSDYTLPENTYFGWYNGDLTIASGVTLTIPKGSTLDVSTGTKFKFIVEEGACIRIEGEPDVNEWGEPLERIHVVFAETYMNGIIESKGTGIRCELNKLYLNGTIHSAQPSVLANECQVFVKGGEYLCEAEQPIIDLDADCKSLIEIRGGVFSGEGMSDYLYQGYTYKEHPEGVEAVPVSSIMEEEETDSVNSSQDAGIKERIQGIADYAKGLFMEAKDDSITEGGSWINGDIVVVVLCVATVVIILLYVIFDFIRSPWKKKLKILIEVVIAVGLVGGSLWYFWNQAAGEQQAKRDEAYAAYQEDAVQERTALQNSKSVLDGMEVYTDGIYQVGKDLEPGVYFFESADPEEEDTCFYIYFSKNADLEEKEVGAWVKRCYVELKKGEYIYVRDAHFVPNGEQPAYQPAQEGGSVTYPKGEYLVGYDLMPGTYRIETTSDICVRDSALTGAEANFSEYNQEGHYSDGDSVVLKDGQHLYTGIWSSVTLTAE